MLPAVVAFKYVPPESTSIDPAYLDNINSWVMYNGFMHFDECFVLSLQLGQILQRDIPHVIIEIVLAEQYGVCLRFSPLDIGNLNSESDLRQVIDLIYTQIVG